MNAILAIGVGAWLGALLRWQLGNVFNASASAFPLGTLLANCLGGYLVGVAMAFFSLHTNISPEWRLLIITGFLGGLTTFSTFSSEVVSLLQNGRMPDAMLAIVAHVLGSLLLTLLGMASVQWFMRA